MTRYRCITITEYALVIEIDLGLDLFSSQRLDTVNFEI